MGFFLIISLGLALYSMSGILVLYSELCGMFLLLIFEPLTSLDPKKPVDKIDEFFFKKEQKIKLNITRWNYIFIQTLNLIINLCVVYLMNFDYGADKPEIIAIEAASFWISWMLVRIISPMYTPYNYNSETLFNSRKQYSIKIWNFIVLRLSAYDNQIDKTEFDIWRKNGEEITFEQIDFAKKQLENYSNEFLKKLKIYLLYPKNSKGNYVVAIEDFIQFLGVVMGILVPIGLEAYLKVSESRESFLAITGIMILLSIVYFLIFLFWRWITRYHLKMQLNVYLPWLIDEEIERRKTEQTNK